MHAEDVVLFAVTRVPALRTAEPKQVLPMGEPQVAPLWLSIQADLSGVIVMCCVALLLHLCPRKVRRVLDARCCGGWCVLNAKELPRCST